ncbi:hypothetical protein ACFONA_07865 [Sphingomonas hylomeconis]|uniref:Uncharacterized protein n=2 Tax=Sphingomonas hylomeconis TaxID=1395958 RepID=A0ABV7SVE0_9SPHN
MQVERRRYSRTNSSGIFRPMTPDQLHRNAVAASCLDDQYIDRGTLLSKSLGFRQHYTSCVLDEFAKCLLSAEQVVVNRTYLQNTEVMQQLAPPNDEADDTAIIKLIDDGAIVAYLYSDEDPTLKGSVDSGAMNADAASAWNRVCERTEPRCVRLDWDDRIDRQLRSDRLATRFAQRLATVAETGRPDLLRDLSRRHSDEDVAAFGRYLRDILLPIARDAPTRRQLYERLVVQDGSDVVDTAIDVAKPFACEIKQLIDLIYNANMAGALGLNNVTPSGAVSADLLADAGLTPQRGREATPDLAAAIAALAVTMQDRQHREQTVPHLGTLSLDQVVRIRDHSTWRRYVRAVSDLQTLDTSVSEAAFFSAVETALGEALDRSAALSSYLYQHHGALRQRRTQARSLIAQAGSLCFGAAIGTAVGACFPGTPDGSFAGNMASGVLQSVLERPLRHLAMRIDPLGGTFAAWRLPELKLTGGAATMQKFRAELDQRRIDTGPVNPAAPGAPTLEAEIG